MTEPIYWYNCENDELYHYGTKGQRWGVRRYQNKDGSLKPAGRKHRDTTQSNEPSTDNRPKNGSPFSALKPKKGSNADIALSGLSKIALSLGVSRLGSAMATASGKKAAAQCLRLIGDVAVVGSGISTTARLIANK